MHYKQPVEYCKDRMGLKDFHVNGAKISSGYFRNPGMIEAIALFLRLCG